MAKYLLGIDNGGTMAKVALFTSDGKEVAVASRKSEMLDVQRGQRAPALAQQAPRSGKSQQGDRRHERQRGGHQNGAAAPARIGGGAGRAGFGLDGALAGVDAAVRQESVERLHLPARQVLAAAQRGEGERA